MKFYLAARYGRRSELQVYRQELMGFGHEVNARWLVNDHAEGTDPAVNNQLAEEDIEDLLAADTFVAFTEKPDSPYNRGGRHVELGMAMSHARRAWPYQDHGPRQVIIVGPRENIFMWVNFLVVYDKPSEFLDFARSVSIVEKHYKKRVQP